jgi:hypothetical protein
MATGNLVGSELSIVGIAKQTTQGTGVAATNFLRHTDVKPQPNIPYLDDMSFQGDMAKIHDKIQGPTSTSFELSTNLFADEVGWPLASLLGDLTVTGTQDPFTTTFSLLNSGQGQTKYYTLTDWNGVNATQYVDCKANELSLAFTADGLVTCDSKWDGISISAVSSTQPTASYLTTRAQPAWRAAVSINSLVGPLVQDISLDLKRTNIPVPAMQSTQAQPVAAIYNAGDFDYTGSATVVFDSTNGETIYNYYKAGTIIPLTVDLTVSETNAHEVKFVSTQTQITMATVQRASANFVTLAIQFEGIANTTDVGTSGMRAPVKVTTKSPTASGTYA